MYPTNISQISYLKGQKGRKFLEYIRKFHENVTAI